tara:strand:+ start:169 stop:1056 length:888 start_codon:yes stop_codon:yes gene_type:complete
MSFFDNEFENKILNYAQKGILNTIFYGPPASGKNTLIRRMLNSIGCETLKDIKDCDVECKKVNEYDIPFFTTSNYIKFNGSDCKSKIIQLVKTIEEISTTSSISKEIKVIFIKNLNCLQERQELLRQVVEETFATCRFVFTVHNIDRVDTALNSRCMQIRIPSPSKKIFENYCLINEIFDKNVETSLISNSFGNIDTLKVLIMYYKKFGTISNVNLEIANYISNELELSSSISKIHSLAEKFFLSEINLLHVCRFLNLNSEIIRHTKDFSMVNELSLYSTILLFYNIKLNSNNDK